MSATLHLLHNELASIVGGENVLGEDFSAYVQDKSPFPQITPGIVVRPGSIDETSAVMALANRTRTPVTARGGGFSLTGFLQSGESIVLDTKRMNQVVEIDEINMTVTAECGIIMKELHDQCAARGFFVHTVAIPIAYTTLGGVLSGVVGGGFPITLPVTGTDLHFLLGLKVVLADGTVVDTNAGGANVNRAGDFLRGANGPDLTGMFVGDGGCFGVKTQATVQISPRPQALVAGCWDFAEFDDLWRASLQLTALDALPYENIVVLQAEPLSFFYLCRDIDDARANQSAAIINRICAECGGELGPEEMQQYAMDMGVGEPDTQDIFINVHRGVVAYIIGKRTFPEAYRRIGQFLKDAIEQRGMEALGVSVMTFFSPVQRNAMYVTMSIIFDEETPGSREAVLALQKEGHRLVVELGGSPEPHQGFSSQACAEAWSPAYKGLMSNLKQVLDPNNILSPGLWSL